MFSWVAHGCSMFFSLVEGWKSRGVPLCELLENAVDDAVYDSVESRANPYVHISPDDPVFDEELVKNAHVRNKCDRCCYVDK